MELHEIEQRLNELEELRQALVNKATGATSQEKITALAAAQPMVKPKTKQLEALLMAGYKMTIETAKAIIKERKADPQTWPLERYEDALAMIAAYEATPQVISTREGWKRSARH